MNKNNSLYQRLAKANIKRNKQMNLPYFVTASIMVAMFFTIINTYFAQSVSNVKYAGTTTTGVMLIFGIIVMSFFTFGYIFYLNSFLIKRRTKEFGLYGILGLEKRHVGKIIAKEAFMVNSAAVLTGIAGGIVFGRLIFMMLMAMVGHIAEGTYALSPISFIVTFIYFGLVFTSTTLYNRFRVSLTDPINLLTSEKQGEKKIKGIVPITVAGALLLGGAYVFSIFVKVGVLAITMFWPCVFAVILATYLLFYAGSQFVLGALKKNKDFYYKARNFVSVSSLTHRMKQNATGLANICILSTMVLVTVSFCCALYFGQENILASRNPNDVTFNLFHDKSAVAPEKEEMLQIAQNLAKETGIETESLFGYYSLKDTCIPVSYKFIFKDENAKMNGVDLEAFDGSLAVHIITLEDYNGVTGEKASLAPGEIIVLTPRPINDTAELKTASKQFAIKKIVADSPFTKGKNSDVEDIFFVAADEKNALELRNAINPGNELDAIFGADTRYFTIIANLKGKSDDKIAFAKTLPTLAFDSIKAVSPEDSYYYNIYSMEINRIETGAVYGGLLFLGMYFSVLFLVNTVIVMYFKQVSEGYDDRERFSILQQVGMSSEEVRSTINRQVLIIFFAPLLVALLHVLAAGNILKLMADVFVMAETALVITWIFITAAVFSLIYIIVFRLTAKTYYRIVEWK